MPTIQIDNLQGLFGLGAILVSFGAGWGSLTNQIKAVNKTLDKEIRPKLKDVDNRLMLLGNRLVNLGDRLISSEARVEILWGNQYAKSASPRQLNERGLKILSESGIKGIIDLKKDEFLQLLKQKNITTAYDAEEIVLQLVADLPQKSPELIDLLKNGAYTCGESIDAVLYVGGIYLRNQIFPDLGFTV